MDNFKSSILSFEVQKDSFVLFVGFEEKKCHTPKIFELSYFQYCCTTNMNKKIFFIYIFLHFFFYENKNLFFWRKKKFSSPKKI